MAVKTIIFDLGNVLLKFDIRIIARKLAEQFSLDEDRLFDLFFDSPLTGIHDDGKIDEREFHRRVMEMLNINMDFGEFREIWVDIFTENTDVVQLVRSLSGKYNVFLMTNINKMHFDYINGKFAIIKEFEEVFTSYEIGERKPHPKIFNAAISYADARPEEIVFIDDRKELIEGAQKLGICGIHYRDIDQLKKDLVKSGVSLV